MAVLINNYANISYVVQILISDTILIENWLQFCDILQSPPENKARWKLGILNGTGRYYAVFSEILETWVSRNPRKVDDLCQVLRRMENVSLAEKLEESFGKYDVIVPSFNHYSEQAGPSSSSYRNYSKPLTSADLQPAKVPKLADNLRERDSQLFSGFVKSGKKLKWPITHGFFKTTKNFSGREMELEELNLYFNSDEDLILVCGIGGIGKTELCRKFSNDIPIDNIDSHTKISRIWLHGDTMETLRDSILKLADSLGVKNESGSTPSSYFDYLVTMILEKCSRLLVIVDNVDHTFEEVRKVISSVKTHKGLFIIVTSRDKTVLESAGITLTLDVLREDQAKLMLQKSVPNVTDSETDLLCKLLQNYPLALQQAAAYIKQQKNNVKNPQYSVSDYIEEFEGKKRKMLNCKLSGFEHDYKLTTLIVWDMTISKMTETTETAFEILKVLAYLEPDQIKIIFLERIFKKNYSASDFKQGLNLLHIYSLVKSDGENLSIHRLIQEVMRLKIFDLEYPRNLFENALLSWVKAREIKVGRATKHDTQQLNRICKLAFGCEVERYTFDVVVEFLFKIKKVNCAVEYTKLCFKNIQFSQSLDDQGKIDLIEKVALWNIVGRSKYKGYNVTNEVAESGAYEVHTHFFDRDLSPDTCLKLAQKCFPNNDEMMFKVKIKVANRYYESEKYELTRSLCKEVLNSCFDGLYKKAFHILALYNQIVSVREQKDILDKLLDSKKNQVGENHTNTIVLKEILAEVHQDLGNSKTALELYKQVRDFRIQFDPNTADLFCNRKILEIKIYLGEFDILTPDEVKAELSQFSDFSVFERGKLIKMLTTCKNKLGDNDKFTLRIKNAIAKDMLYCRNHNEVLALLEEIIMTDEKHEVEKAYNTMQKLGVLFFGYKMFQECRDILEKVLAFKISNTDGKSCDVKQIKKYLQRLPTGNNA